MATAARVAEYRDLNRNIIALAQADLETFYAQLDLSNIERARVQLSQFMVALTESYGATAQLVAAQFYDTLRADSPNATGTYRAVMGDGPDVDAVDGSVRWAVGALTAGAEGDALDRLLGAAQRHITNQGRNTLAANSYRDPSAGGWARVPSGPTTCGFCLMLASRGPVYTSAAKAGEATHYHDRCDCVPVQIWDGDALPDGYDPDALYEQFTASGGDLTELDADRAR